MNAEPCPMWQFILIAVASFGAPILAAGAGLAWALH